MRRNIHDEVMKNEKNIKSIGLLLLQNLFKFYLLFICNFLIVFIYFILLNI
jgi:hypothetical protein